MFKPKRTQTEPGDHPLGIIDTWDHLKADIRFIIKTRGPLKYEQFGRAHFWNRLQILKAGHR